MKAEEGRETSCNVAVHNVVYNASIEAYYCSVAVHNVVYRLPALPAMTHNISKLISMYSCEPIFQIWHIVVVMATHSIYMLTPSTENVYTISRWIRSRSQNYQT